VPTVSTSAGRFWLPGRTISYALLLTTATLPGRRTQGSLGAIRKSVIDWLSDLSIVEVWGWMPSDETEPAIEWHKLIASRDFHDVGEFTRGGETRIYRLRVRPEGAELWRVTERPGGRVESIKEALFKASEEAGAFLEEVQRTLTAGGWRQS
jgi:hypothetical protein